MPSSTISDDLATLDSLTYEDATLNAVVKRVKDEIARLEAIRLPYTLREAWQRAETLEAEIIRLKGRIYILENMRPENYIETLEAAEAEIAQLKQVNGMLRSTQDVRLRELQAEVARFDAILTQTQDECTTLRDEITRLRDGLRPFVEDYDFSATDYLADNADARVFESRTIESLIRDQRKARALLARVDKDVGGA